MSAVVCLREFINERLTAAAEDIFTVFQKTIVEFEEEIDRQRRLLSHRTELPQQHVWKEEEVLADQERNSSLDRDDPETPQVKEEQEELCTSLEEEQMLLKQETEIFMLTPTCEESDTDDSEVQTLACAVLCSAAEKEHFVSRSVKSCVEPEPNSDEQLFSHNSHAAESQDHKGAKHGDSGSTRNAESRPQKRDHKSKNHTNNKDNSTMLKIHTDAHTGKQCLKCDICGKACKYKSKLRIHMRKHTGERPYPCNTCEKRFSQLCAVKEHMKIHTGEKPYKCKTCGKGFRQTSDLKNHTRVHTGEKPYLCNTCEKRFTHLGGLKKHMRIHTGEKPYPCNTCEKRFSRLSALKVHVRTHTGENPYNCKTCGRDFRFRNQLKDHMRRRAAGEECYMPD